MAIRDINPFNWLGESEGIDRNPLARRSTRPLSRQFSRDIEEALDNLFNNFNLNTDSLLAKNSRYGGAIIVPKIDISETDQEFLVEAELPGINEKDIEVSISNDGTLTLKGKRETKKEEKDKSRNYYRVERSYGSFERSLSLPNNCDTDKVVASFKNGVLNIKIPKSKEKEKQIKKIKLSDKN